MELPEFDPAYFGTALDPNLEGCYREPVVGDPNTYVYEADRRRREPVNLSRFNTGIVDYSIRDNQIYEGINGYGRVIGTIEGNHVYKGLFPCGLPAYTIADDGRIYEGQFACGDCVGRITDDGIALGGYNPIYESFKFS